MRALPPALGRYFRARRHAFALALLLVALPGLYSTAPPVANLPGLAQLLEHAAGVHTAPGDIAWEPRRGVFAELARGRSLLFLGAAAPGGARDLYRAWVRLTPGGQPLSVRRVVRLTDTPLADECGLTSSGTHAAFVTVSEQRARSVTLLGGLDGGHSSSLVERLFALGEQGTFTPLARTDLLLEKPAARVGVTLDARTLKLAIDQPARDVLYDLERRTLGAGAREVRLLERRHSGESASVALLDLARSELGSKFVQGAGRAYYAAGRTIRGIFGAARGDAGEQRWQALSRPWLGTPAGVDRTRGTPEPLFQKRVLRPQRRADARLVLVDLDLRQVELAVQAGSSFPRASAGVPGDGRTPRDPESFRRIVAVFNAGPEAPYDRYGTMAAGRVLVPAIEGEPGVYVDTTRGPVIERFPWGKEVPASVTGFEQRRTLLVENGLAVPAAGAAERSVRRRSALCTTRSGGLFYAFADALDAGELAGALIQAGCRSAIPLATGPERLGFALADFDRADQGRFELVDAAMNLEPARFATGSSRDFFYVLARDGQPKSPPGVRWAADSGTQPPPAWLPGILRAELTLGALRIDLVSIAWGGVGYRLRAGGSELGAKGEPWVGVLADDERARALAAVELGHATTATRYGLALGTTVPLALKPAYATLVLGDGAPPRILLPSEPVTLSAGEHAVQLPLLADDGDVTARARERGDARLRSALGVTPDGRVVIALLRHDSSDPLAVALRNAGCRRVVELDRGSHHPAFVGRAGADSPLPEDPKTTTLWVLAKQAPASGQ